MMINNDFIEELWYGKHPLSLVLLPISWIYSFIMRLRFYAYRLRLLPRHQVNVPVIIVGNITVGGTGKTPLTIWLCNTLAKHGHKPGILSRGYGGVPAKIPQQVRPDSDPNVVGDEPVLLAKRTGCPVAVSPDRYLSAVQLLEHRDCDVLVCDDGLQHLSFDRDLEIAVIDGDRRFGNGHCLPAGPLREPLSRLSTVDIAISNGLPGKNEFAMRYTYGDFVSINDEKIVKSINEFRNMTVHAVTGIGNPSRFHSYLRSRNIRIIKNTFSDHYNFTQKELLFDDDFPVVMTEKDAVKCTQYKLENTWYLPVSAEFDDVFYHRIEILLREIFNG
jgi:tetraacyldisaccharide 4'-kinase